MTLRMTRTLGIALLALTGVAARATAAPPDPKLLKEAKVSEEKARAIALKEAAGTVKSAELEKEKGVLVWSFDIETPTKGITEVLVSAVDGHVVDAHHETAAGEAAEKKKDAAEAKASKKAKPKH